MSLAAIQKKGKVKPPRLICYGPGGIGKTSFAASMDKCVIVQSEDGIGKIECDHFPVAVACIDSLDWLETLLWDHVCKENGWAQIDTPAYGKGYVAALDKWKEYVEILNRLRDEKSMTVIQIAHNQIRRYEDPSNDPHDRHEIKLHRKAADLLVEHSDAVFFANYKVGTVQVKGKMGMTTKTVAGDRTIFTEQAPGYMAKNRYGLPSEMPFEWATIREEMLK
jgi:hypothetical protein